MYSGLAGSTVVQGDPKLGMRVSQGFYAFNITPSAAVALFKPAIQRMQAVAGSSTDILSAVIFRTTLYPSYRAFFKGSIAEGSSMVGITSMISSHLLGQAQLPDLGSGTLIAYAKRSLDRTGEAESKLAVIRLQGVQVPPTSAQICAVLSSQHGGQLASMR